MWVWRWQDVPGRRHEEWNFQMQIPESGQTQIALPVRGTPAGRACSTDAGVSGLLRYQVRIQDWMCVRPQCISLLLCLLFSACLLVFAHDSTWVPLTDTAQIRMTSLLLISVRRHGRVTQWKSIWNFTSSASPNFLVHNVRCAKCT